ncbi:MAG: F0F1 ATP synthase subunit gamma, partial [Desulfobacterales bacterium]|nr:F0F1 ATP synthase subunit gamma [Desulfobacterales bacterium]
MAGMGTRDIKRKIKSVNNTRQITKAMELVSTAKLKRAKDRMNLTKTYFETVMDAVQSIIASEKSLKHDFVTKREVRKTLYIVITGDRGLCGGYNINAIKAILADVKDKE